MISGVCHVRATTGPVLERLSSACDERTERRRRKRERGPRNGGGGRRRRRTDGFPLMASSHPLTRRGPRKLSRLLKPVFVEIIRLILKKNHRRSGRFSHSLRLVVRKKCCQAAEPGPSAESRTSISASPAPFLSD
ncbi:uncharacterized protein LOC128346350 isoform X1 [Hemicordylus capensis]|uniref:uncharacterized protein LOC128346350 isoform X1 n=1 Tax=Hemicordylus capensis TaxID=884348 RepID=UPI0023020075|nr:uncharacterized protein LOC128346350 isoform X1 [Hemicordylus capensis]